MARIARQDLRSSIFSVKQITDKPIFRNREDREMFVEIIKESKEKFDFDIYGYCLLDDNAFWLILNTKHRSVSSIMQSITISYAKYRNDASGLFIRRYKSEPLYSVRDVEESVDNLKKDSRYSDRVYCFYNPIVNLPWPFISEVCDDIVILDGKEKRLSDLELENLILKSVGDRNEIIKMIYQNHNVTQKQLANYYNLTKSSISKILK